jgi:sugar phosphate isomerase/epimerase
MLDDRLGLDVPKGWWPNPPMLKAMEAAGFGWVQARTPPRGVLRDSERLLRHARELRRVLDTCGLKLVLHAPDDLSAGDPDDDRMLDGLLDYAAATGARFVVYHGLNFPAAPGADEQLVARLRDRAAREEASLHARVARLERLGVTLAIEHLAPVHPGPPRVCYDPILVRDLVLRLGSPRVGMLFDAGHANIVAGQRGTDLRSLLEPVLPAVVLFHLHDNLGARGDRGSVPGLDPLRLDLHLAPGAGRLGWGVVAGLMLSRSAPLVLEVHPPHRPEPLRLAQITAGLLLRDRPAVGGARPAVERGGTVSVPVG